MRHEVDRMVGESAAMRALRGRLRRYGAGEAPVLVQGETGVGKELAARTVHRASGRPGPFVAMNCGAIPRPLLEAELFGSVPGAFTGARKRVGHVAQAEGGTLFLDEVGELSLEAQVVLLRVLESGVVRPVGSDELRSVDFRLVSATHQPLRRLVSAGRFRADLYHRLATLTVEVPPLRERSDDLPLLARALIGAASDRLTDAAWARLRAHRWPGNVRELRNVLVRALADTDGPVDAGDLQLDAVVVGARDSAWDGLTLKQHLVAYVRAAFERHGQNVRATARALQVSHTTVYRYLTAEDC